MNSPGIHLIRHGHSSHVHDGRWFAASTVHEFEDAYDAEGIREDSVPSAELMALASQADVLACSDLSRAVASARRLAVGREPEVVGELREIRLEPPAWVPLRLPLVVWDYFSHLQWTWRIAMRTSHPIAARAGVAADWLEQRASGGRTVVAVTHGGMRRLIASQLVSRGWRAHGDHGRYHNWSCWSFSR